MKCESRSVRTVTTKYRDSEGNVKSKRRAELSGKSVVYEGEYSETDSEAESEAGKKEAPQPKGHHVPNTDDPSMYRRQKLLDVPNIPLKPVKMTEFNESIDENSDDEAKLQAKINEHLSINKDKSKEGKGEALAQNVIKDETKEDEKSDMKIIDETDEKTGLAIRTSIENKYKTNENLKVCKADNVVDVQETEDAIVKKITSKTRTTKSVVKTTTTTTTKKSTIACVACVCVFFGVRFSLKSVFWHVDFIFRINHFKIIFFVCVCLFFFT